MPASRQLLFASRSASAYYCPRSVPMPTVRAGLEQGEQAPEQLRGRGRAAADMQIHGHDLGRAERLQLRTSSWRESPSPRRVPPAIRRQAQTEARKQLGGD
jgi:hypothetical protein